MSTNTYSVVLLQQQTKTRVETEEAAIQAIQDAMDGQTEGNYEVIKSSYTQKTKKSKGEIVELYYIVDITKRYNPES